MLLGLAGFLDASFWYGDTDAAPGQMGWHLNNPLWFLILGVFVWIVLAGLMWVQRRRAWLQLGAPIFWILGVSYLATQVCGAGVIVAVSC